MASEYNNKEENKVKKRLKKTDKKSKNKKPKTDKKLKNKPSEKIEDKKKTKKPDKKSKTKKSEIEQLTKKKEKKKEKSKKAKKEPLKVSKSSKKTVKVRKNKKENVLIKVFPEPSLLEEVLLIIATHPRGVLQTDIYKAMGELKKNRVMSILAKLAKEETIRREKSGRTFLIFKS